MLSLLRWPKVSGSYCNFKLIFVAPKLMKTITEKSIQNQYKINTKSIQIKFKINSKIFLSFGRKMFSKQSPFQNTKKSATKLKKEKIFSFEIIRLWIQCVDNVKDVLMMPLAPLPPPPKKKYAIKSVRWDPFIFYRFLRLFLSRNPVIFQNKQKNRTVNKKINVW
jgi:hypothetical protein